MFASPVAASPLALCDASFQTLVRAAPAKLEARAVWLNRQLLKWPGADAGAIFKLYHSAAGAIVAQDGARVKGADGVLPLNGFEGALPGDLAQRFKYLATGPVLAVPDADSGRLAALHRGQLVLVRESADGTVRAATRVQSPAALDDIYGAAAATADLGATPGRASTAFKLWAPTAQQVSLCSYDSGAAPASSIDPMRFDAASGVWHVSKPGKLAGKYYKYAVDVVVDG